MEQNEKNSVDTDKIFDAFNNLTAVEHKSLIKSVRRKISGTTFADAEDLLHEALLRTLDGRRNCPDHVEFGIFLSMTMRSVADADRQSHGNRRSSAPHEDTACDEGESDGEFSGADFEGLAPSAEEELILKERFEQAAEALEKIRESFESDRNACGVLDGILCEMTPREIRAAHGLSEAQFDAARHRVQRRLNPLREAMARAPSSPERPRRRTDWSSASAANCSAHPSASRAGGPNGSRARAKKPAG